jgi:formylglycine-generating enzyme required for sulfatase activity
MKVYTKNSRLLFIVFTVSILLSVLSCSSIDPVSFEREPEYIYGTGNGETPEEAEDSALNDLIASALAETQATKAHLRSKPIITSEMAKSFNLPKLSPFVTEKKDGKVYVVYRLERSKWQEMEGTRQTLIRTELTDEFENSVVNSNESGADRLNAAGSILSRLSSEGLHSSLTTTEEGSVIFSDTVLTWCKEYLSALQPKVMPEKNFVDDDSILKVTFLSDDGEPVTSLPLSVIWEASEDEEESEMAEPEVEEPMMVESEMEESEAEEQTEAETLLTDKKGMAFLEYPEDPALKDTFVNIVLAPAFSAEKDDILFLKSLDNAIFWEFKFRHFTDISKFFADEVKIAGGSFTAGAVEQDRRAEPEEKARKAKVADFYIDKFPVTNAMYRVYLKDMKIPESEYPDFWDDSDTDQENHPVVGVSLKEAQAYAEWLSKLFDMKKRLPTEDEWEKAAHGGIEGIFPWGDESPTVEVRANYNGNNLYDGTSPVGSFENGVNAFGLFDMAGNVWQWTSTPSEEESEGSPGIIVKGGSWMDGPNELRVSNRKELDPSQQYGDVGFRLVREVSNE